MTRFRFMEENDLDAVTQIYERCFPAECNGKCENAKYRENVLLAIVNDTIVGMVTIDYLYDNFLNEKTGYITNVCVDPSFQNKRIGYAIMAECEKICQKERCMRMQLTSNRKRIFAHKLYSKLGFYIYDTEVFKKNI